jgi:hypothetical protein
MVILEFYINICGSYKIKKIMWFLNNKVLLTKDNLAKRNWNGSQKYCFCDSFETVQHLFLSCPFAKIVWRIIYFSYNMPPLVNITNMLGNWLNGVTKSDKSRIRIGVSALCPSIWISRNDIVLIDTREQKICRLSDEQHIGFNNGFTFSQWVSGTL